MKLLHQHCAILAIFKLQDVCGTKDGVDYKTDEQTDSPNNTKAEVEGT